MEMKKSVNMGKIVSEVRKNGQTQCPKCKDGTVMPIGKKETSHWFVCDKCKYKIVED